MLTISQPLRSGGGYYAGGGSEGYYANRDEAAGTWWGSPADELGLTGQVEEEVLSSLLAGYRPSGGKALVQNAGTADRQGGWDLTFSADKTVSVLWSQVGEAWQREIERAHDQAVRRALEYLEKVAGFTRRGALGEELEPTKFLCALFPHFSSRARDPQLHTHCVLLNLSLRPDGSSGTLWTREIFRHKMAAGAIYRAELAARLERHLGLVVERREGVFGIKGVSQKLVEEFSKRRRQIENALQASGATGAVAAKLAALETRDAKLVVQRDELLADWRNAGKENGWGREAAESLFGQHKERNGVTSVPITPALTQLTDHESHFPIRDLVRRTAEHAPGTGADAKAILEAVQRASEDLVPLGLHRGEEHFTTVEMLALENRLLHGAEILRGRNGHQVPAPKVAQVLNASQLTQEQQEAVRHVTCNPTDLALVVGLAGTGKSTLLASAFNLWASEGYDVVSAALSGKAAAGLQAATGIASRTIASLLSEIELVRHHGLPDPIGPSTVLVVDEAAMVGTRQLEQLIRTCQETAAKLVLVGDPFQLQPIHAGGPFRALTESHGASSLRTIVRQKEEWARDAVKLVLHGEAERALEEFQERKLLTLEPTFSKAIDATIKSWAQEGAFNPQQHLMLANEVASVNELNKRAQEERLRKGQLSGTPAQLGNQYFFTGDQIVFGKNSRRLRVQNGTLGMVIDTAPGKIVVKCAEGHIVHVDLRHYSRLALGYALTTHKAQGATAEHVYVLLGGQMQCRELSYVQVSRARTRTTLFGEDEGNSLAVQMERSRPKELATSCAATSAGTQAELLSPTVGGSILPGIGQVP